MRELELEKDENGRRYEDMLESIKLMEKTYLFTYNAVNNFQTFFEVSMLVVRACGLLTFTFYYAYFTDVFQVVAVSFLVSGFSTI